MFLSFNIDFNGWFLYVNLSFDLIFCIDLVLIFVTGIIYFTSTGYYDKNSKFIFNYKTIAINYLKSFFIIDFASTFPFEFIVHANNLYWLKVTKIIECS